MTTMSIHKIIGAENVISTAISVPEKARLSATPSPSTTEDGGVTIINGREARNLAEKQRRDKLNASIGELATMVPHVVDAQRRMDKTAVLRFATHGLRLQYVFGKSAMRRNKVRGHDQLMTNALLQLLDSFLITLTCHGQIVLISSSVEHLLGHCQSDLYGQNILQITHPDDHNSLRQHLIPKDIENLFGIMQTSYHSQQRQPEQDPLEKIYCQSPFNQGNCDRINEKLRADKRCFTVRLARASTRSEARKVYELVKIDGCFRRSDYSIAPSGSYPIVSQLIRRSRSNGNAPVIGGGAFIPHLMQHDAIAQAALHGVSGNDIVLVAMARIIRPPKILNWPLDANRLEYKTRHLIDGRIIECDQRISLVAGYLKDEVRNLSPFSFMHQDDVRWVIVALRQMYDCNSDYGESCFRLLSRNGNFIYMQTRGYLEIDKSTNKVHSFVCINTLLDEEDGRRKVQEMKNRFSIIINAKVPTNSVQDLPASQNPQQLERIVLYLIEDLQKRQSSSCIVDEIHSNEECNNFNYSSTPPLALVPPEPASVKSSISQSVSVVNITAAKNFHIKTKIDECREVQWSGGDEANGESPMPTDSPTKQQQSRATVLQMQTKTTRTVDKDIVEKETAIPMESSRSTVLKRFSTTADDSSIEHQPSKRILNTTVENPSTHSTSNHSGNSNTADIHNFISTSLRHVCESLHRIDAHTSTLRKQRSSLPSSIDHKLDAIIIEQQKQNEFLANIKTEYEDHVEEYPQSDEGLVSPL
uniref:Methoprene-tolerant n=1 Tax=Glossina pallidipes TaxID=7398 RepID=A0A1B0ABZ5_GLOPL